MPGIEVGQVGVGFNPQSFVGSDAYKFINQQGMDAIQRLAGSNGTLLTGGTLKDLMQFGQGNAASFWGQQLDHDRQMAAINAGISEGNANRTLGGLSSLMGYGMNAANGIAGAYGNYGQAQAGGTYGGANAINAGIGQVGNTLSGWLANRNQQPAAATPPFNPAYGAGVTGSPVNYAMNGYTFGANG